MRPEKIGDAAGGRGLGRRFGVANAGRAADAFAGDIIGFTIADVCVSVGRTAR